MAEKKPRKALSLISALASKEKKQRARSWSRAFFKNTLVYIACFPIHFYLLRQGLTGAFLTIILNIVLSIFIFSDMNENRWWKNLDSNEVGLRKMSFHREDLSGEDLFEKNLSRIDFRDANLSKANLNGADLSSSNLSRADLSHSDLRNTSFIDTNLIKANLSNANLCGVDLSGQVLLETSLCGAEFNSATLVNADLRKVDARWADFSKSNLSGANLTKADLGNSNLTKANLRKADLSEVNLSGAKLTKTDLGNSNLSAANLRRADLDSANLRGANINRAKLQGTNFKEADLSHVDFRGVDLSGVNLRQAKLVSAIMTDVIFDNVDLSGVMWGEKVHFQGAMLHASTVERSGWGATNIEFWLQRGGLIAEDIVWSGPAVIEGVCPRPGDVFDNRFRVLRQIGRGGESFVFKAVALRDVVDLNIQNGDHVLLKYYLTPDAPERQENKQYNNEQYDVRRAFRGHAQVRRLDIPGLRRVIDLQESWIAVLEWVEGESYDKIINKCCELPKAQDIRAIVKAYLRVVWAVAELNRSGMVFRDLKPHNIIVSKHANGTESWTLIDTGLLTGFQCPGRSLITQIDTSLGTPEYAPPEILRYTKQEQPLETVDVYTVGSSLYAMLTRRTMFQGELIPMINAKISKDTHDAYVKPARLNRSVDKSLSKIIQRCVQFEPYRRYQTVQEIHTDLERWLQGKAISEHDISAFTRYFEPDGIEALFIAAIKCDLCTKQEALLAGLPKTFVNMLPSNGVPAERLLRSLHTMNEIKYLTDSSIPLKSWLKNATLLADKRTEAEVFHNAWSRIHEYEA